MNLNSLNNKTIGILGLGIENQALVKHLLKHKVKCQITVCDARNKIQLGEKYDKLNNKTKRHGHASVRWQLGKGFNQGLEKFDILFRAPGWPINCPGIETALKAGTELSSPMKLFFALCPTKNMVGVTGTKGKGTTSSLIYEILKAAGKRTWLGGNIGVAPFSFIDKIRKNDWVVLELSSFQLEDLAASPRIAVVTNLYPEHLAPADPHNPNYHQSLKAYYNAKLNIIRWQKRGEAAILHKELVVRYRKLGQGKKIFFAKSRPVSKLIGEHNKENVAAAAAAAKIAGVKEGIIKKAVADFEGLKHRLEMARELKGVKYYDDSFATTPESTIIALKSFAAPVVLLLGGADKGADFKELAEEVKKRVKFTVLLAGKATARIKKALLRVGYENNKMKLVYNMKEAVQLAKTQARPGEVVLLSTACASFGLFNNYKERGDLFKREVRKLK